MSWIASSTGSGHLVAAHAGAHRHEMRPTVALHDMHSPNDLVTPRRELLVEGMQHPRRPVETHVPHPPLTPLRDLATAADLPPLDVRRAAPQSGERIVLECVVEAVLAHRAGSAQLPRLSVIGFRPPDELVRRLTPTRSTQVPLRQIQFLPNSSPFTDADRAPFTEIEPSGPDWGQRSDNARRQLHVRHPSIREPPDSAGTGARRSLLKGPNWGFPL